MQARDRDGIKGKRGNIMDELFNFSYSPTAFESWFRLACQVTIAGCVVIGLKALDGEACGIGFNVWKPYTWSSNAGCFVRGLVKGIPAGFIEGEDKPTPQNQPDLVAPPQPVKPVRNTRSQ